MVKLDELRDLARQISRPETGGLPPGTTDEEMASFEHRTGLSIPSELSDWLKFTNGPLIGPGGTFGIRTALQHCDIEYIFSFLPEIRANKWLPIGADGCGCYYVLALESDDSPLRPIYFIDPYQDGGYAVPTYAVASGLWEFLWFLFREELGDTEWPFKADYVLEHDPTISQLRSAPLPWNLDGE